MIRFALPLIAVALAATPALAAPTAAGPSVAVPIFGLALDRADVADALDARLARAARNVCAPTGTTDLREKAAARQCAAEALAAARSQLQSARADRSRAGA